MSYISGGRRRLQHTYGPEKQMVTTKKNKSKIEEYDIESHELISRSFFCNPKAEGGRSRPGCPKKLNGK